VADLLDKNPFHVLGLIAAREIRRWNPAFGADRLGTSCGPPQHVITGWTLHIRAACCIL
jgi:hypothetical protein